MALDKRILTQYLSEKEEIIELRSKIDYLSNKIPKLENRIAEIEAGHTVKDKVRGGEGGLQSFVIEGVPYDEYNDRKAELEFKKKILKQRQELLHTQEMDLILRTKEVEQFISGIDDSFTRRIITLRVLNGLKWTEIAERMGGGNTESCVKMIYQRFLDKKC
jgi:hypothetical protein